MQWVRENEGRFRCGCGCGEVIPLKPDHFSIGVPKYLHGHNSRVDHPRAKPKPPRLACQCGCGELAAPGNRFISGHNTRGQKRSADTIAKIRANRTPPRAEKSGQWKGGRTVKPDGYVHVRAEGHPFAKPRGHYVNEHRLVLEQHLIENEPDSPYLIEVDGQLVLRPDIHVHHRNGVKDDNRLENLEPLTASEHARLHREQGDHPHMVR